MHTNINNNCVAIGIFYNQKQWHVLLKEFIKPLIDELQQKRILGRFYLFGEKKKGEHIKVVFLPFPGHNIDIEYLTGKISRFLNNHPSETPTTAHLHFPLTSFFSDYPNNSFCFVPWHAANFEQEMILHPHKATIRYYVSKAIAKALDQEEILLETIYTFIIYMQLGLVKAFYTDVEDAICSMENLRKAFPGGFEDENDDEESDSVVFEQGFKGLFEQNKELLDEIILEIWSEESEASLPWLVEWKDECVKLSSLMSFEECYFQASSILYKHLGFPSNKMLTNSTLNLLSDSLRIRFLNQV